ncbi:MAG: hypothetical protein NZ890_15580 [Myxococcota bacterium]|nr:hypothetical protein [Myxococcota bacterium]
MRLDLKKKMFVGVRIDNKMRDQLDRCPQRDRIFFESPDGRYLQVLRAEEDGYIGKLIEGPAPVPSLEDVCRNVLSILNRICPGRRDQEDVKIMVVDEAEPLPRPEERFRGAF